MNPENHNQLDPNSEASNIGRDNKETGSESASISTTSKESKTSTDEQEEIEDPKCAAGSKLHESDAGGEDRKNEDRKKMMMMMSNKHNDDDNRDGNGHADTSATTSSSADWCTKFKYVYSTLLLLLSIVIVVTLIFDEETAIAQDVSPILAFCVMWIGILWLSIVEGGQGALVGLVPVQKSLYQQSHPMTYKCTSLAHAENHLDKYLIGRQFLVILIVFIVNQCGAPVNGDADVWSWSTLLQEIFVRSSLSIILVTAMMGQLHCQVNATNCMLDYLNNWSMMFTLKVSLALEASGAMHAVYVLQYFFARLSKYSDTMGGDDEEDEEAGQKPDDEPTMKKERDGDGDATPVVSKSELFCFWIRVIFSMSLLFFSFAVTLTALFNGQTNMWSGIPVAVSILLFFSFIIVLGILEGTQIAVFAVSRLPMEELARYPKNVMRCIDLLLLQNDGQNVPRFMIGRQIMVTLLMFIIARVTTVNVDTDVENPDTIWGVPKGLQEFFNTGLLGAIIVTIVGAISWKLLGSAFPVLFLSNPMVYVLIQIALALEASGICSGAWVLAILHRRLANFKSDDHYIGTPEDRAAKQAPDSTKDMMVSSSQMHGRSSSNLLVAMSSRALVTQDESNISKSNKSMVRLSLREPMNQCGSSRYLQVENVSQASSRYLLGKSNSGISSWGGGLGTIDDTHGDHSEHH